VMSAGALRKRRSIFRAGKGTGQSPAIARCRSAQVNVPGVPVTRLAVRVLFAAAAHRSASSHRPGAGTPVVRLAPPRPVPPSKSGHPPRVVSGWPLFEGGTINAEDDAR